MSLEDNKELVRRFIEAYNERKLDLIDNFVASDYVDHTNKVGHEGLKQLFAIGLNAFPDWHETIENIMPKTTKSGSVSPTPEPTKANSWD